MLNIPGIFSDLLWS